MPVKTAARAKSVHVLFVHGVGRHSRLSSLFQAFQSLRAFVRSPEAPLEFEDPYTGWTLSDFDDASNPVYLKLTPGPGIDTGGAQAVYLYEVNYSAIGGVVRENQPLDLTHLLVSLDLAVNVARNRLRAVIKKRKEEDPPLAELKRHLALAEVVQKLTGVFVATTVPVLGLPSILLRKYISPIVAEFTRFFEDVATFALDRNGEALISAHVDHTIESIAKKLQRGDDPASSDEFIVVAHSLGTVVTHSFIVRHWGKDEVPDKVITLGSPIGIVSWMWRFLDFRGLRFSANPNARNDLPYFCWKGREGPAGNVVRRIKWINVINHLDPIATAFPLSDVFLAMPTDKTSAGLDGAEVEQRYIKTGGLLSIGASHTQYFDDKEKFLKLLGKVISLVGSWVPGPEFRNPAEHWRQTKNQLLVWQIALWAAGVGAIWLYFAWLASYCRSPIPWGFMLVYALPPVTIGWLTFFQRLIRGGPTKRTLVDTILELPWFDRSSLPYCLPQMIGIGIVDWPLSKPRPNAFWNTFSHLISFIPTLVAMVMPIWWMQMVHATNYGIIHFLADARTYTIAFVGLFMIYTLFFAGSEFARHWRTGLQKV